MVEQNQAQQPVKKEQIKTYKDWERLYGQGQYANKAKLTKEQYIAIKKKEIRSQNAKKMFGMIGGVAEKITRNFRAGQMEGFSDADGEGNIMDRLGKKSQNKALSFGEQQNSKD